MCDYVFTIRTPDNKMSEDGSCGVVTRRQLKKVITLLAMTKKVASFYGKNIGVTPSVAVRGTIGVARILSGVHFFLKKVDDLFSRRPQNTV